ncbi:helix-turn-helix domain-containing protein, partial [Comamonas sp.]
AHRWPGNLRELHNALRYAAALAEQQIDLEHLPDALQCSPAVAQGQDAFSEASLAGAACGGHALHAATLEQVLAQCQGNVSEAARLLGVNRSTIHRRIQRQQLSRVFARQDGERP